MSGKNSQAKLGTKNHFMDAYQRYYLAGNRLDLGAIDLERLEALLFGVAHAHDLIGRQVQDLASGSLSADQSRRSARRRERRAPAQTRLDAPQVYSALADLPGI